MLGGLTANNEESDKAWKFKFTEERFEIKEMTFQRRIPFDHALVAIPVKDYIQC